MKLFTLEVLPAQEGDCLILHWGSTDDPHIAVVDGGPGRVYENTLRKRLDAIRKTRKLERLPVDLVMISHVDNDHVMGIKKMFAELRKWQETSAPPIERFINVQRLWHNTFNDILGDETDGHYRKLTASVQASVGGTANPELVERLTGALRSRSPGDRSEDELRHEARDVALILAGHGEGRAVRDYHDALFKARQIARLNSPFARDGAASLITTDAQPRPCEIAGMSFHILGPQQAEIDELQRAFDEHIEERGLSQDAFLSAFADDSISNLSSIVCLVEADAGGGRKRILLTGDARGDKIVQGLRGAGMLDGNGRIHVDVLKVPHHGSDRNVELSFFETVVADVYVFSADGRHGNPDRAVFEWLCDARGRDAAFEIVLTYPVADIDSMRRMESRKPWDQAAHSLEALFAARRDAGYRFKVTDRAPWRIDLGEECGPSGSCDFG